MLSCDSEIQFDHIAAVNSRHMKAAVRQMVGFVFMSNMVVVTGQLHRLMQRSKKKKKSNFDRCRSVINDWSFLVFVSYLQKSAQF